MPETIKTDSGNVVIYRTKGPMSIDDMVKLEYLCNENPNILPKEKYMKREYREFTYPEASVKENWILKTLFNTYPTRMDQSQLELPVLVAQEIVFASKELKHDEMEDFYIYSNAQKDIHCITTSYENSKQLTLVCCFGKNAVPLEDLEKEAIEFFKKRMIKKLTEIEYTVRASIERLKRDEYVITEPNPEQPYFGGIP